MLLADQVVAAFHSATHTVSVPRLAQKIDPEHLVTKDWTETLYQFSDGSELIVTGRGSAHRMEVIQP